jgi:tRNA-dihydrouridine synthase
MRDLLPSDRPVLVLAPMQEVTDLAFMRVMHRYGGPDIYVTEYFRVHGDAQVDRRILSSITENPTGRPVFAQLIGQDIPSLVRVAKALLEHPVAGIDLNLGCPAPQVCNKDAGGGLLRDPGKIDRILGALREAIDGRFTVKTRIGFESGREFAALLDVFARHALDGLAIHGRTVRERYQTPVHPRRVAEAVRRLECPVIANGNVVDVVSGRAYLEQSGAAGLMIGRGAIRNPWIFDQLRASFEGETGPLPRARDLLGYIEALYEETARVARRFESAKQVSKMKRSLAYISQGLDEAFEYQIRRVRTPEEFFAVCREFLSSDDALPRLPPERSKLFCGFGELLEGAT